MSSGSSEGHWPDFFEILRGDFELLGGLKTYAHVLEVRAKAEAEDSPPLSVMADLPIVGVEVEEGETCLLAAGLVDRSDSDVFGKESAGEPLVFGEVLAALESAWIEYPRNNLMLPERFEITEDGEVCGVLFCCPVHGMEAESDLEGRLSLQFCL